FEPSLVESNLDQRAVAHHPIQVVAVPCASDVRQDGPPLRLVVDHPGRGSKVGTRPALQVEVEVWICLEVEQPSPLSRVRSAADVDSPVDVVEHDLEPPRLPAPASPGRDVDRVPALAGCLACLFCSTHSV